MKLTRLVLFDKLGLPRCWSTVWSQFYLVDLSLSTSRGYLRYAELLYEHADTEFGYGSLDNAIASADFNCLNSILETYFLSIRNRNIALKTDPLKWKIALQFVIDIITRLKGHLGYSQLELSKFIETHSVFTKRKSPPEIIRSLPASTVEALYELLDPESKTNPFQNDQARWQAYTIFIALLNQGLRRSELLILPVDARVSPRTLKSLTLHIRS